jgi:hypothetical protein
MLGIFYLCAYASKHDLSKMKPIDALRLLFILLRLCILVHSGNYTMSISLVSPPQAA